jgi:hypothetical protein
MKNLILTMGLLLPLSLMANSNGVPEEVRSKIKQNVSSFKDCYIEALKTNSKLGGKVVLDWDVDEKGLVKRAVVKLTTMKSTEVENCMVDKLKAITFSPAPAGQVINVTYPFVFSADK